MPRYQPRKLVNVLDVLLGLLILAWFHSVIFGGFRISLSIIQISTRDSSRILLQALAIGVLRNVLLPFPHLVRRLARTVSIFAARPDRADTIAGIDAVSRPAIVLSTVVVTRVLVLSTGLLAVCLVPLTGDPYRDSILQAAKQNPLATLNERWDAGWYAQIALDGYEWEPELAKKREQGVAFFPGFPMLVRAVLFVTDRIPIGSGVTPRLGRNRVAQAVTVGTIIALIAFTVSLVLLHQLAKQDLRPSRANRAVVLCAAYPFAIFFSAPYTESVYLLAVLGTFLTQRLGRFGLMAVFGFLAGVTRQTGFLLCVALAVACATSLSAGRTRKWVLACTLGTLSPLLGAIAHSAFLWWRFADPLAWFQAQKAWIPSNRWSHLWQADSLAAYVQTYPYEAANTMAVLMVLPLIWASRRIQWSYFTFGLTSIVVPLIVDVAPLGRLTSVIFPVFIVLAGAPMSRRGFAAVAAVWLILQLAVSSQFYGWRPLY